MRILPQPRYAKNAASLQPLQPLRLVLLPRLGHPLRLGHRKRQVPRKRPKHLALDRGRSKKEPCANTAPSVDPRSCQSSSVNRLLLRCAW